MRAARFRSEQEMHRAVRAWAVGQLMKLPFIAEVRSGPRSLRVNGRLFGAVKRQLSWLRSNATVLNEQPQIRAALTAHENLVASLDAFVDAAAAQNSSYFQVGTLVVAEETLLSVRGHLAWLRSIKSSHTGRQGWAERTHFVAEVASPLKASDGAMRFNGSAFAHLKHEPDLELLLALSIVAGLVRRSDFTALIQRLRREGRAPTLVDGLEVERKRLRLAIEHLTAR